MAKLTLSNLGTTLSNNAATTINNNSNLIEDALEKTLSRDGTSPNQMESDLDLNHNDLLNVGSTHTNTLYIGGKLIVPTGVVNVGDFATVEQGALADSAVQPEDLPEITLEMFGAIPDGNFGATAHLDGTDNTIAVTTALSAAALSNRPIRLLGVYRVSPMTLTLTQKVKIIGEGPTTGFVCPVYEADVGIWDKSGCDLSYFRVHVVHMQAKLPNQGALQSCVFVSNRLMTLSLEADDQGISGFNHHHLTLTRRAVASGGGGSGWFAVGNAYGGYVGDLDDTGSTSTHTYLCATHWGARGEGYGLTVYKTWHPHDIRIGALTAVKSQMAISLSASYNIEQVGPVWQLGGMRILYLLPGDETDTLADTSVHPPGSIGKNQRYMGPFTHVSPSATSVEKSVYVFSQGTSPGPWRFMEDNPTVGFMSDLEMDVEIGDITVISATLAGHGVIDASYYRGVLKVGNCRLIDSAPVIGAVSWSSTQSGRATVKSLNGSLRYRAVIVDASSNFTLQSGNYTCTDVDTSTKTGLYVIGTTEAGTVSGAHSAGALKLTLAAAITRRMSRNTPITIGTSTVYTTGYCPPGMNVIPVTELPVLAGGEAVVMEHGCDNLDVTLSSIGGYYGGDISRGQGVIRGKIKRTRGGGLRTRNGSRVSLVGMAFEANGFGATSGAVIDLVVDAATGTFVTATGCTFGLDVQPLMANCVSATTADGTVRRVTLVGCHFAGYSTSPVSASSANNWTAIGCTDKAGALFSNP